MASRTSAPVVGVIGAGDADERRARLAYEVGCELGRRGATLVTGGLGGVMEAASRGAHEHGARVVGILPGDRPELANPYVDIAVATGLGDGRNAVIANTADAFIAVGGSYGTLSEIAFALKRGKAVITLDSWSLDPTRTPETALTVAHSPAEAVDAALRHIRGRE